MKKAPKKPVENVAPGLAPADIAAISPAYWAVFSKIRLQTGVFSFEDHGYQMEPMQSRARRVCYMKGTQGGFSEIEVLKALHGLIHGRYPQGVLYMFPTSDNVREFSQARFGPLIRTNKTAIGRFVRSQRRGTDTTSLKRVGEGFLYLRGARLSQAVGIGDGEKESVQLRSIPVDRLVFDELDLMDESVIAKARGRLGHSRVKEEVFIANPTLPDYGIDKIFRASDQRHLFRKCACGTWTCAELSFPGCVKVREDGTGYIGCDKCGAPVGIETTEWVPAERTHTDFMHGYRWSQLSSVFTDPAEILAEFNDPPEGNLADVYRLRLGLPYVATEDRLSVEAVRRCCGLDLAPSRHRGPCAMGVDIGKLKHVIIGMRTGQAEYELLRMVRVSRWEDIHDLAKKYNVRSAVIDIRPYEDEARRFQAAEVYKTFLCEYNENTVLGTRYNDEDGIVRANRTEVCDQSHRVISERKVRLPRSCPEVDEFAKQCSNAAKVLETNKRTGTSVYRYRQVGSGGDHFRHALNYFLLAAQRAGIVSASGAYGKRTPRTEYAII